MIKKRILVLDDDKDILNLICELLRTEGYSVLTATSGKEGLKKIEDSVPDMLILDLNLPDMDGFEVCRVLRKEKRTKEIPIIMLTVKSAEASRVAGLEIGADDYVIKPFSQKELLARIKALFRRVGYEKAEEKPYLEVGSIRLDLHKHLLYVKGKAVDLTPMEFNLLYTLIKKKGQVLTRGFLTESVWGYEYFGSTRTVDVHIGRLRKKLGSFGDKIQTVEGVGYILNV